MKAHLFVSSTDGSLYDTRDPQWASSKPLRAIFDRHYRDIKNSAQLKATLRAGRFNGLGGYPLYFICDDGEALCFACCKKELRFVIPAVVHKMRGDGWRAVATAINYEDAELYCANCNEQIKSAYGD